MEHAQFAGKDTNHCDVESESRERASTDRARASCLAVRRSGVSDAANELVVMCPMVSGEVLLQRCAFCEYEQGLLLDSSSNDLTLRCSFS